jgi:hypothetical protein
MRQHVAMVVLASVAMAACSGGDDAAEAGGSVDEWCSLAERIVQLETDQPTMLDVDGTSPDALAEYRSLLGEAAAVAPDEVLADANAMADGVDRFANVAATVEFDFDRLDDDDLVSAAADVLALAEPIGRIQAYNATECGLTVGAADEVASASVPATAAPATSAPPATVEPTPSPPATEPERRFTGDPDSQWCVVSRRISDIDEDFEELFLAGPDAVESYMSDFMGLVEQGVEVAPPEVADAAATLLDAFRALDEAFAAAGYDPFDTDLSVLDERDTEMTAANDVIERYNADVCGIESDEDDDAADDNDFDPTAGTIREQAIAEFVAQGFTEDEAICIFDSIDFTNPDVLDDMAAISEILTACGIDFERMMELEP